MATAKKEATKKAPKSITIDLLSDDYWHSWTTKKKNRADHEKLVKDIDFGVSPMWVKITWGNNKEEIFAGIPFRVVLELK